jgi:hypothetical protein
VARLVICADCGKEKKHYAHGLCEACCSGHYYRQNREKKLGQVRRYREENREKISANKRRYYLEHRGKILIQVQQHRQDNREKILVSRHRRYWENREEILAHNRCRYQKNPEKAIACAAHRRARKRGVASTLTPEQLEFERRIGEATYPGEKLHLHHLVPLGKGNHSWGNITFIPASFNQSIGDKLPEEIYKQRVMEV